MFHFFLESLLVVKCFENDQNLSFFINMSLKQPKMVVNVMKKSDQKKTAFSPKVKKKIFNFTFFFLDFLCCFDALLAKRRAAL